MRLLLTIQYHCTCLSGAIWIGLGVVASGDGTITPEARHFFETRIRPVLVERCFECHSAGAKKPGGKLRLDNPEALLKGGASGPLVVPGKPGESLLLQALQHDGVEMPPETPLPETIVHDFREWVRMGVPYPDAGNLRPAVQAAEPTIASTFWSFQAVGNPDPPEPADRAWSRDPLDRFVLARMEAAGLKPTADARAAHLVRRLYIDLLGLPPTMEQTRNFVKEARQQPRAAVEQLVDDLLASPHFGERWGRHWLDVARYGESNGNDGLGRNATFPHAWRYRDYVIQAFNDDVPYDRFLREQVAGDLLPATTPADRDRQRVATGFLAIGSKPAKAMNDNFDMDVVADQVDVVSRGVMGISMACARCHDHKHDPLSTRDYYALAGIFQNTETLWGRAANEKLTAPPTPLHELSADPDGRFPEMPHPVKVVLDLATGYAPAVNALEPILDAPLDAPPGNLVPEKGLTFSPEDFAVFSSKRIRGEGSLSNDTFSVSFWFRNGKANQERPVTAYLFSLAPDAKKPSSGDHLGISGNYQGKPPGKLFIFNGNTGKVSLRGTTTIPPRTWNHVVYVREGHHVKAWLNGGNTPELDGEVPSTVGSARTFFIGARNDRFAPLQGNVAAFAFFNRALTGEEAARLHESSGQPKGPGDQMPLPPGVKKNLAMGVRDRAAIKEGKINIKGSAKKLGPVVPRGFPSGLVIQAEDACLPMPTNQSGRVELAHWLTHPAHPLTTRVMVNRVWQHLFGQALVGTPDDFGVYGQRPTHPELLDHLATRFVDGDWSVKKLVRLIVLSRTYQLSSTSDTHRQEVDPENTWYSRHQRRRLDAESLRDSVLLVSGRLETRPGRGSAIQEVDILLNWPIGEATNLHKPSLHRSVYLCMMRNAPPPELAAFDLPDGMGVTGRRHETILPGQSLYLINSPLLVEQAQALAARVLDAPGLDDAGRIDRVYQWALQRAPHPGERKRALAYLHGGAVQDEAGRKKNWASFCQALFMTNEFRYID